MLALVGWAGCAQAQLATSFLNVTGIKTKILPNAVQVRIETDGTVQFGGDQEDWVDFEAGYVPKPTQSLRIRIVRARAKLPAFVPIEVYPIDGAAISLGREEFRQPYFSDRGWDQGEPRVDVQFRFAAPVIVRKFAPEFHRSVWFGDYIGPREAIVELSQDRRAVQLTINLDRSDTLGLVRLDRSPKALRKTKLEVSPLPNGKLNIQALHTPLNKLLEAVASANATAFLARPEAAETPISLNLPECTPDELLNLLALSYGLGNTRDESNRIVVGRGGDLFKSERLQLTNLSPGEARLLFPDFMLPYLRADAENNSLIAFGPPPLIERLKSDIAKLDTRRPQFRVEVAAWQITDRDEYARVLRLARAGVSSDTRVSSDADTGQFSIAMGEEQQRVVTSNLQLLSTTGRARLFATPFVLALSGERGTVFLGQTRYVKVLRQQGSNQLAQALALKIGFELNVTPRGGASGPILVEVTPRLSTVDDVEPGTGLPTLGIREVSSTVRIAPRESILLAGMDADLRFDNQRGNAPSRWLGVGSARRHSADVSSLIVLLSVTRTDDAVPTTPAAPVQEPQTG